MTAKSDTDAELERLDLEERRLQARLDANLDAADKALKQATATPTVKGSTGQKKPHPGFEVAARCDELALRLHSELEELRHKRAMADQLERARELTIR